jgi:hypothetical protein
MIKFRYKSYLSGFTVGPPLLALTKGVQGGTNFLIKSSFAFGKAMDDSSYRRSFDLDKKNEIHYHSWKEHLKMSKIAKFGCEML